MEKEKYEVIIPERIFVVNSLAEASNIFKKCRVNGITIRRIKDIEENLTKHNSSSKKDCYNYCCPAYLSSNKCEVEITDDCPDIKRSPS